MKEGYKIRQCSPLGFLNESEISDDDDDDDDDDFNCLSQPFLQNNPEELEKHADPRWTDYLKQESEEEEPRTPIAERIRLREEKEKRSYEEAYSRGYPKLPDNYVPKPPPKRPTKEEQEAKYQAWLEKLARIKREKEALWEKQRKEAQRLHLEYCKIQKDNRTRDYYWKPDPLYYLHLRNLGYSKIACDKALFYVDNKSVKAAVNYLKENPNPTELTKEEVMAVGEEVLRKIRPIRPPNFEPFKENLPGADQMEVEQDSQAIGGSPEEELHVSVHLLSSGNTTEEDKPEEDAEAKEDKRKRGVKRNYMGEEVKVEPKPVRNEEITVTVKEEMPEPVNEEMPEPVTEEMPEPVIVEQPPEYQMIFVSNTALLMDSITLSLEVSKVTIKIMDKLMHGGDEMNKMQEEWIKSGSTMNMYKGMNNKHIYTLQKQLDSLGYINYMAECSHYRSVRTKSPTVLAIFGEKKSMKRVSKVLQKL